MLGVEGLRTGSVADGGVEWRADDADVERDRGGGEALDVLEMCERRYAGEGPLAEL